MHHYEFALSFLLRTVCGLHQSICSRYVRIEVVMRFDLVRHQLKEMFGRTVVTQRLSAAPFDLLLAEPSKREPVAEIVLTSSDDRNPRQASRRNVAQRWLLRDMANALEELHHTDRVYLYMRAADFGVPRKAMGHQCFGLPEPTHFFRKIGEHRIAFKSSEEFLMGLFGYLVRV